MKRLTFEYFDAVEWAWQEAVVIAPTAEVGEAYLRKTQTYRISTKPYCGREEIDSLSLEHEQEIPEPPYIESIKNRN